MLKVWGLKWHYILMIFIFAIPQIILYIMFMPESSFVAYIVYCTWYVAAFLKIPERNRSNSFVARVLLGPGGRRRYAALDTCAISGWIGERIWIDFYVSFQISFGHSFFYQPSMCVQKLVVNIPGEMLSSYLMGQVRRTISWICS